MTDFLGNLRRQNQARSARWTGNADSMEFAMIELAGEVGELANAIKKHIRFQNNWAGGSDMQANIREEIGDIQICLDRIADKFGIDLVAATTDKFNATSEKRGFPERL